MNDDNDATVSVFSNEDLLPVPAVLATLMVLFLGTCLLYTSDAADE